MAERPVFAERLQVAREESGLSIETASQKSGIKTDRWKELESGRDEPSFREGMSICKLFAITPDWALDLKKE